MKKKNRIIPFLAILLMISSNGCKKDWLDVNYNPRELTDNNVTPDLMLPALLEGTVDNSTDQEVLAMWMGYWCAPSIAPTLNFTTYTNVSYTTVPNPGITFLESKAAGLGQDFYVGITKVIRAVCWSRAVDKVNDVPYFEAYQLSVLRPKYDSGKLIYEDLMKQLSQASTLISGADIAKNPGIVDSDIMFHGNKQKWLMYINTLKLRLLVHQANLPDRAAYIASEMQAIQAQGSGFLPSGTDASVNPGYGILTKVSPYYGLYSSSNTRGGGRGDFLTGLNSIDFAHANEYALNLLKSDNDPRIGFIYTPVDQLVPASGPELIPQPAPADFKGSRFGLTFNSLFFPYQNRQYLSAVGGSRNTDVVNPTSAGIIKGNNMNAWSLTSVESAFLQAEAVLRGWIPGDKEAAFKLAVKESFRWLNLGRNTARPDLSDAVFEQWYAQQSANPKVSWTAAPDKYKLLMFQKYVAMNGIDPLETWTDYRRNGRFPDCPVSVEPTRVANTIPIRLVYTADELITNAENVKALGPINMFTGKIWWMP